MPFSRDPLDISQNKIMELERSIFLLQENVTELSRHIKETQQYLVKLAHHQSDIAKRLSTWPFLAVDTSGEN